MKISCGILPYRIKNNQLQVFLVHPGGPFFAKKDIGFWGISKGELDLNEDDIDCAIREFKEEVGIDLNNRREELKSLGEVTQKNGKTVKAWALKDDLNDLVDENGSVNLTGVSPKVTINLKGRSFEVPEIDKGMFFNLEEAMIKINERQRELVEMVLKLFVTN